MKHTPKEIAELLKDKPHQPHYIEWLVKKAIEEEREACAATAWAAGMDAHNLARGMPVGAREVGSEIARAIRARSNAKINGAQP